MLVLQHAVVVVVVVVVVPVQDVLLHVRIIAKLLVLVAVVMLVLKAA